MLTIVFVCVLIFISIYYVRLFVKWSKLPPGPFGIPLLGYLPFLGKDHHLTLSRIAEKYGPIFSLRLGLEDVVVISGWKSIKEAMHNPELLGRPQGQFGSYLDDFKSIGLIDGKEWRFQRRLYLKILHELGFARQTMEDNIKCEINYFLSEINRSCGKPMDVGELILSSASNNVAFFLFGHRYDYDDPLRKSLSKAAAAFSEGQTMLSPLNFFKSLVKLVFWLQPRSVKKVAEGIDFIRRVTNEEIRRHKEQLESRSQPEIIEDFIDGCLLESKKGSEMTDLVILGNVMGFFGAGSGTQARAIMWQFLFLATYPDDQIKIQEEIDNVTGGNRLPNYEDRALMPYTQAVIAEILRWVSLVPVNVLRRAMSDTTVGGVFIPKDTCIVINTWSAHMDKTMWKDPHEYEPRRFLSEDGKQFRKREAFLPFSIGKRFCTGEIMGRCELFLYCTMILQKYTVSLPNGTKPSLKGLLQLTLLPEQPPVFIFTKRV